jgi:ferritin-like metal-binding protein YciE
MAATTLQELFVEELRDTYDAEKRLVRALPKIARSIDFADLLDNDRAKELLGTTLDEEKAADQKLNTMSPRRAR